MKTKFLIIFLFFIILPTPPRAQSTLDPKGGKVLPKPLGDGLDDLARQIATRLSQNQKRRIAVLEFVDLKANVTDLGRYCSERLITRLFQSDRFTVVERNLLNKIIAEQKLSLSSIIDPASAQKLGRVLGVDSIAVGSISDLGKTIDLNARLLSTETGEVFSAASIEITKDDTVCSLMGTCGSSLIRTIEIPEPSSRKAVEKISSWRGLPIVKGEVLVKASTVVFGKKYPDSIYAPNEVVGFKTAKGYQTLKMLVGVEDNAQAKGSKGIEIQNEKGIMRRFEVRANRRPVELELDISDSDVVAFSSYDENGEPRDFIRFINVSFISKDSSEQRSMDVSASVAKLPEKSKTWTMSAQFFTFELSQCKLSGSSAICDLIVTNNDKDRNIMAGNDGQLIDDSNNIAQGRGVEIANSGRKSSVDFDSISGIRTRARVYYEGVSNSATKIARLNFRFYVRDPGSWLNVEFRDIPLTK